MSNIIDKIQLSGVTYDIGGSGSVSTAITSGDTNAVAGGAVYDKFDEVEQVTAEALNDINDRVSEDEEVTAAALNTLNTNKQDKLSAGTGISISGNVISATGGGGGNPTVELTQAEYDALVTAGTVSADTYYIITDATPVDMSNYYTTAQTNTLFAGKQDTLSAGTGIDITSNVISVTGSTGGKAIEAGRGISVTTGATADTISVSLPISAGTGMDSIREGYSSNYAGGNFSHAEGYQTIAMEYVAHSEGYYSKAYGQRSHAEGNNTIANNFAEHASGSYNVSSSGSSIFGNSGNTLFSVGNGTSNSTRHNAFEIRQNGDIYLTLDGQDVKLQDQLGGGTVSTAITRGDTNAVAGGAVYNRFDEVEQVTAQALNVLNESLSGKQDTLSAGTNITIVDNVISAEGGGQTYTAGEGIDITNSVISISLPISAGTGSNSIIEGHTGNIASGQYSHAEGYNTTASTDYAHAEGYSTKASGLFAHAEGGNTSAQGTYSHAEGNCTITTNVAEHASGQYNTSNKANTTFGDSGNTLFSVGNGTANNSRHNAFEIRQNGDIYLSSGGTDIKLQDHLGGTGGGKAIEAGRGISVTTGETADTVSFNLPISANTNNSVVMGGKIKNSFTNDGRDCLMVGSQLTTNNGSDCCLVVGYRSSVKGDGSAVIGWESKSVGDSAFVFGTNVTASTSYTFATGYHTIANNNYEHTSGSYNVSNTGSTNADKTLFSVGNGTAYNARHNAFEIRQNGDIYISSGGTDIKLQDYLGGGGSSINVVQTTGSSTTDVMSQAAVTSAIPTIPTSNTAFTNDAGYLVANDISGKTDTSAFTAHTADTTVHTTSAEKTFWNDAATNASNAVTALGGLSLVKLTQAQYDALATKDNSTLYVIVG